MRKSMQSGMRRGSSSGEEGESAVLFSRMEKRVRTRAQEAMDESFKGEAPGNTGEAPGSSTSSQTPPPPSGRGAERRRSRRW
jgi:hypothetical protein